MLASMRFGLALPQYGFSLPTGRIGLDDAIRWARRAEDLGFDSVWLSDVLERTLRELTRSLADLGAPGPPPVQEPVPIWVGGKGGPRLLRLAARYAAGWNVVWRVSPEDHAGRAADVAAACGREGRDPATFRRTVGLYGTIGLTEDDARRDVGDAAGWHPRPATRDGGREAWRAGNARGPARGRFPPRA